MRAHELSSDHTIELGPKPTPPTADCAALTAALDAIVVISATRPSSSTTASTSTMIGPALVTMPPSIAQKPARLVVHIGVAFTPPRSRANTRALRIGALL